VSGVGEVNGSFDVKITQQAVIELQFGGRTNNFRRCVIDCVATGITIKAKLTNDETQVQFTLMANTYSEMVGWF